MVAALKPCNHGQGKNPTVAWGCWPIENQRNPHTEVNQPSIQSLFDLNYISKMHLCYWECVGVFGSGETRIAGWSNPSIDWTHVVAFRCTDEYWRKIWTDIESLVTTWGAPGSVGGMPRSAVRSLRVPATNLGAPGSYLRVPGTTQYAPATTQGAPTTYLSAPVTTLGALVTSLEMLVTSLVASATSLGSLATSLGVPWITVEQSAKSNISVGDATSAPGNHSCNILFNDFYNWCMLGVFASSYLCINLLTIYLNSLQAALESNAR